MTLENQHFNSINRFKNQINLLLGEFRRFPFDDQLEVLSDVRRFLLEVENICRSIATTCNSADCDNNKSEELISEVSSYNDIISKRSSLYINVDDHNDRHQHQLHEGDLQEQAATLEETDIRQIADYLIGLSKLTDTTSLLELSPCVDHTIEQLNSDRTVIEIQVIGNEADDHQIDQQLAIMPSRSIGELQFSHQKSDKSTSTHMCLRPLPVRQLVDEIMMLSCIGCRSQFGNFKNFEDHQCRSVRRKITSSKDQQLQVVTSQVSNHRSSSSIKLYECDRCERKFVKRPSLFAHQRQHVAHPNEVVCLKCGITSPTAEQHALHVQRHAEHAPYRCNACGETFVRRQQYDRHTAGHRLHDCIDCNQHFSTKKQLAKHRRLVHGILCKEEKKHECLVCHKKFLRRRQLENHQRRLHSEERSPIRCLPCSKNFRTHTALAKHLRKSTAHRETTTTLVEGLATPQLIVPPINTTQISSTSTQEQVEEMVAKVRLQVSEKNGRHGNRSNDVGVEINSCDDGCPQANSSSNINRKKGRSTDDQIHSYLCAICGSTFLRKQCLARHNRQQHDGRMLYECHLCDYKCKCKANLKRHVELHVNDHRRFVCELCGAPFNALGTLKEHHAYMHSDERQHACSECGKAFKAKSALQRHARVHNDRRPYACNQCSQSYKRLSHLKRHMNTVHGVVFPSKRVHRLHSHVEPLPPMEATLTTSSIDNQQHQLDGIIDQNFLMFDVDHDSLKSDDILQASVQCSSMQTLPRITEIVPLTATGSTTLPSIHSRLIHHNTFNVDYGQSEGGGGVISETTNVTNCSSTHLDDQLQSIDVLQSDFTSKLAASNSTETLGDQNKIADIFW